MTSLDPQLAYAEGPHGGRRFFDIGQHPATQRLAAEIRAFEAHREQIIDSFQLIAPLADPGELARRRGMLMGVDRQLEFLRGQMVAFEEGESIAKADWLRMVERGM